MAPKLSTKDRENILQQLLPSLIYFMFNPEKENVSRNQMQYYSIRGIELPPDNQPLDEKTLDTFLNAMNKVLETLKSGLDLRDLDYDDEMRNKQTATNLHESIPLIDTKLMDLNNVIQMKDATKVQEILRNYLRAMKPQHQIILLNRAQTKLPYMIMDPTRKALPGMKYGYADLMRFLCNPVHTGEVRRFTQNEYLLGKDKNNPFYSPIWYPIPDIEGNTKIEELMKMSRRFYAQKIAQYQVLKHKIYSEKLSFDQRLDLVDSLLKIMYEIQEHQFNPVELSKLPLPQSENSPYRHYANYEGIRPMAKYRRDHFMNLIKMLNTYKRVAPYTRSRKTPENTGVEFVSQELTMMNQPHGITQLRKRKTRSRSRSRSRSNE